MRESVPLTVLEGLRIASPCAARWEDMAPTGDDKARHCGDCNLSVHNFSALSREEAVALVASHMDPGAGNSGQRLCATWRKRADGTIIFRDCPVGLAKVRARMRRCVARVAAVVGLTSLFTAMLARANRNGWEPREYESFAAVARWVGAEPLVVNQMPGTLLAPAGPSPQETGEVMRVPIDERAVDEPEVRGGN